MSDTQTGTPRSVSELVASIQTGQKPEFVYFVEHRSVTRGPLSPACFSQWWPSRFTVDDVTYPTAEHFMMAGKARLFGDEEAERKILSARLPKMAYELGRQVRGFDQAAWEANREQIVFEGNLAKFSQDEECRAFLLSTGDRVLAWASPTDTIWGIGVDALDLRSGYPERWRGLNLLGFTLMRVREKLARE